MKIYEDGVEREAKDAEIVEIEARHAEAKAHQKAEAKEAAAREKAKAEVLAKLGLTADEVAVLLA